MSFKYRSSASVAALSAGMLATGFFTPSANAATATTPTNFVLSQTSNGSSCSVAFDSTIIGDTNDGSNRDRFAILAVQNGTTIFTSTSFVNASGRTNSANASFQNSSGGPISIEIRELVGNSNTPGTLLSSAAIPTSLLQAEGGACFNTPPTAAVSGLITTSGGVTTTLDATSSTDPDGQQLFYSWTQTAGPTVTLQNANTAQPTFITPFSASQQTLDFEVTVSDIANGSDTATQTVIVRANQTPIADAGPDQTVGSAASVTLDGTNSSDPDRVPVGGFTWTQLSGPTVTLSNANTATPSFTAPTVTTGQQAIVFQLVVTDPLTVSSPDTVTINVIGNQSPTADAGADQTVAGGSAVSLNGSATDPESDPLTYQWTQSSGATVSLTNPTSLTPSFTAPPKTLSAQALSFELVANDGTSNSSPDSVAINIPANIGPSASATGPAQAPSGSQVSLDATASTDGDGDGLTYSWTQTAGPSVTLSRGNSATPSFTAPSRTASNQVLTFEVTVDDGFGGTDTASVSVTVPANIAPVADAGPDATITSGSSVSLDGSGSSDPEGDPLSYSWVQTSGAIVTLAGANSATPTFTAPAKNNSNQSFAFDLIVNDGITNSPLDSVVLTLPGNLRPIASVTAPTQVTGGSNVTLDASASRDGDGDPLNFAWSQLSGPAVTLSGSNTAQASFTAPARTSSDQVLSFEIIVTDGFGGTDITQVGVTVPANGTPVADAGSDATVQAATLVTLDGSGSSDLENDPLTYAWTQTAGPNVSLSSISAVAPTFMSPAKTNSDQALSFDLVVNDGTIDSPADSVTITVPANVGPTANAGTDATVAGGASVSLDGSGSTDGDGDALTYTWTQTSGPSVSLSDPNAVAPSFTAPAKAGSDQTLAFDLIVSDGFTSSAADSISILVPANIGPSADAGADLSVSGASLVTLDGSASTDGDGDTITYQWTQVSGPSVTLSDPTAAAPTFTAPLGTNGVQTLGFELVVNDGTNSSVADLVEVSVAANQAPVANAGLDIGPINSGDTVTLDGSGSADPDGNPLTYTWTQTSGTAVTLSDPTSATPTFTAPFLNSNETLSFELIVNDGVVSSPAASVSVSVQAVGSITIVQDISGADTSVTFTSTLTQLNTDITTVGGTGSITVQGIPAGNHTITAEDLTPEGYALTAITCSDDDSAINVSARSVAITLSPSEDLSCTFSSVNTRDAATQQISEFMSGRAGLILANQPDAQRRIGRLDGAAPSGGSASVAGFRIPGSSYVPANFSYNSGQGSLSTSLAQLNATRGGNQDKLAKLDVWAELNFGSAEFGSNDYDYQIAYLGADWLLSDRTLIGFMGQYDVVDGVGNTIDGDGWMAGPYATVKLSENLYGDFRAAWGQSENSIAPVGTFRDDFETTRSLFSGALVGVFDIGGASKFRPEVAVRYFNEEQDAYRDSFNVLIPSQTLEQGDLSFSPRFDTEFDLSDGWTIRPFVAADGIYTFGAPDGGPLDEALRARLEVGAMLLKREQFGINFSANLDGVGSDDFQSSGFLISLTRGF